jgi:hypothetical protein
LYIPSSPRFPLFLSRRAIPFHLFDRGSFLHFAASQQLLDRLALALSPGRSSLIDRPAADRDRVLPCSGGGARGAESCVGKMVSAFYYFESPSVCRLLIFPGAYWTVGRRAQGTPVNIIVGSHVWLEDPDEAWVDGVVTEIKGGNATISTANVRTVRLYLLWLCFSV